jgi:Glycosyl transferase family 2
MTSHHSLGLHTVFLARENIAYLKEWIIYHALLGVQHFYLYDNTGSVGRDGSTSTTNKYGINFFELTKNLTDADIGDHVDKIIADVSVDVTLIKWQPRDGHGRIFYGYNESVYHCIRTYGQQNEWMAFIDVDEFLFSPSSIDMREELSNLQRAGCNRLIILQKKFLDRFLSPGKYVTDIYDCIEEIDTSAWAPKNIVHVDDLILGALESMHSMPVRGQTLTAETTAIRFNHYNVNRAQLQWMKWFYQTTAEFRIDALDDGMKRYQQRLHKECRL